MINKILILVIISGIVLGGYLLFMGKTSKDLVKSSPQSEVASPTSSITPSPSIPSFQFSSSTDLKSELEKVGPEIKNNDFDSVKKIIASF